MDFNVIDLWIHRPDYTYDGITVHEVECPNCGSRYTWADNIDTPTHCFLCDQENYKEGDIAL